MESSQKLPNINSSHESTTVLTINKEFSGIKDVDKLILEELDDKSLLSTCSVSRYTNSLCDETFFMNRSKSRFPNISKPEKDTWRNFYLKNVFYVDILKREFNTEYSAYSEDEETPEQIFKKKVRRIIFSRDINNYSETVQLEAVSRDGYNLNEINNPSEKVQLAAVSQNAYSIQFIKDPSEKVQLAAVSKTGSSIKYIKNPSEKVQLASVRNGEENIQYIINPSEKVQLAVVSKYGSLFEDITFQLHLLL